MSGWAKKRRIMRRYDQSARVYDALYREEQVAKIRTAVDNLTMRKEDIVLDAGCGTGLLFKHMTPKTNFVVGTDISRGILKEAKKKAAGYNNAALILADADNMPFYGNTFEVVFAVTLLQNMPNPQVTLSEINRISKSNARIIVTWLRKAFTQKSFLKLLKRAWLKVEFLKLDEHGREYVCICSKLSR